MELAKYGKHSIDASGGTGRIERRAEVYGLAGLLFRAKPVRRDVVSKRHAVGHGSHRDCH
jgi:hypothetical protein